MNVTDATSPAPAVPVGRRVWDGARRSGERMGRFARHPAIEFRRNVDDLPWDYPASVVMLLDAVLLVVATIAMIQRHEYLPNLLPLLAMALTYVTGPLYAFFGVVPKPLMIAGLAMGATALFLAHPVENDVAPLILVLAAGEVTAIATVWVSAPVTIAMLLQLALFARIGHIDGLIQYSGGVVCGWMTGRMLLYQTRYLRQEREYQDVRATQAADEERRRIAREVHDVIAHSLSVTLLHVTAARHSLQTDRDVDEAVDALTDAERLGRQAMADIRRTVGLLDQRPSRITPEPGLDDIGDLVSDFLRAGMAIDHRLDGDSNAVSAGLGLAVYRICQESLANIAKHASGASVRLRIEVCAKEVRVRVSNTLPAGATHRPGRGMGISGMRQRAMMLGGGLSAGPSGEGWRVDARIPYSGQPYSCVAEDSVRSVMASVTRKLHEGRDESAALPQRQEGV
ncbi:sensor histidine kinase [Nocardia uniformis]|uniref:histidine kinase n=1 Tax=Nocardia uniformis TaxID=53432 RepID=A0A849CC81_9NOCA|nr:histidine kinase [Nocardia uniformis]NNH72579.1 sensor histidine kinase [Nocardia uniformis]